MIITELARLIKKVEHMDITLLAGEKGLHHSVSWVHMVETIEASDFLDGGQLAFTTGIGLNTEEDLLALLKVLKEKDAAGVILNTGPFLEKVPQSAIDYCREAEFPLYAVPWKVHLAEIMRICCMAITREEQRMLETSAAFKNAIFFPKQEELYVVPLSQRAFRVNWCYSAAILKLKSVSKVQAKRLESLCMSLENIVRPISENAAVFVNEMEIILIFANVTVENLQKQVMEVKNRLQSLLLKDERLFIGVGRLTKSIRCLYKSYNQAKAIEKLQEANKISPDKIFYDSLGIYRLLMGIEDHAIMQDYYNRTLKPLLDYDEKNNMDLCLTLREYLTHNGSVKETADALFVHRNTINYKINKIQEILGIEMSSLNARTELMIAFDLQDIM